MVARRKVRRSTRRRLQTTGSSKSRTSRWDGASRYIAAGTNAAYKAHNVIRNTRGLFRDRSESSSSSSARAAATSSMNDYKKTRYSFGKPMSTAARGRKLVRQNQQRKVYGIRNYGAWNRGAGAIALSALQEGLAGTTVRMPVDLWDLTAVPQLGDNGTSTLGILYPATQYRLQFTAETDSAQVDWQTTLAAQGAVQGKDDSSTVLNKLACMYPMESGRRGLPGGGSSSNNAWGVGGPISFIEKFKAEMLCYGPKQAPTKWCIQIVQLAEEVSPSESTQLSTAFWQQISKPYGYSPLESDSSSITRKYMRVLRTYTFLQDAPESSEDHVQARMRHVTLQGYLNRRANYNWDQYSDLIDLDTQDTPENADQNSVRTACHVHPKARVYMMIRALTEYQGPEAIEGANKSPSYDLKLAVTHRCLD